MFLERILADKRAEVAHRQEAKPIAELQRLASTMAPSRDFRHALRAPGLSVIAEVKRASPSRGPIAPDLNAAALARSYEEGDCSAVSVLTDETHFRARPGDLGEARAAVSVPVLRKDFLIDEYQLWESRTMGADAVLLIVAALEPGILRRMITTAGELGICPLVEVHTEGELEIALGCGADVIGINNRDLHSFAVALETTHGLAKLVPSEALVVSESGIAGPREASLVRSWGADAILVGEALVASENPGLLLSRLRVAGNTPTSRGGSRASTTITTVGDRSA